MITELYEEAFWLINILVFIWGATIGSFANVCILRIPEGKNIVRNRSCCMNCGQGLRWYHLIPILSYLFLGGRCFHCKLVISRQYPLVEVANGVLYVLVLLRNGWNVDSILYCFLATALLILSVIDARTYEIPIGINYFILALGLIHLLFHWDHWLTYGIGLVAVSIK